MALSLWSRDTRKIENLRVFMEVAYRYWQHRGWWRAAQVKVIDVVNGLALFLAVFFLAYYVNWEMVLTCKSEECVESFPQGERSIFLPRGSFARTPGSARWIAVVFLIGNAAVVVFEVFKCVRELRMQREMHAFAKQFLKPRSRSFPERVLGVIVRGGARASRRVHQGGREGYVELGGRARDAPPHFSGSDIDEDEADAETNALVSDIADWSGFGGREQVVYEEDAVEPTHDKLPNGRQLPTETLDEITWSTFLQRLCWVLRTDRDAVRDTPETFDELRAVQTLMLHANFFIALHQPRVVGGDTFLAGEQAPPTDKVVYLRSIVSSGSLKLLDENILDYIIASQFDAYNSTLARTEEEKVAATRHRVRLVMITAFLLYPFIVSVFLTKLLVKNIGDVRTRGLQEMFAVRTWTDSAKWTFRLFNEVPHVADARLRKGLSSANAIVDGAHIPSPVTKSLQRVASTVVLVVLLIAFLNPAMLTLGSVWGLNLLWWLSSALVVYATFESNATDREYTHAEDLTKLVEALHYEEPSWGHSATRCASTLTTRYLRSRAIVILENLLRVVFTPAVLMHLYFDEVDIRAFVRFIHSNSEELEGVGTCFKAAAFERRWGSDGDDSQVEQVMRHILGKGVCKGSELFPARVVITQEHLKNLMSLVSFTTIYGPWASDQDEGNGPLGEAVRAVAAITARGDTEGSESGTGFYEEYSPVDSPVDTHPPPPQPASSTPAVVPGLSLGAAHQTEHPFVMPLSARGRQATPRGPQGVHTGEQDRMRAFTKGLNQLPNHR